MKKIWILFGLCILSFGSSAYAKAPVGFHEGPYFLINTGVRNFTADNNARTGAQVGRNFEPVVGFNFGWNLTDYFAPELQARYSTSKSNGSREQLVNVNVNAIYFLVIDQLTSSSVYILPFLQGGPVVQAGVIPGDPSVGGTITVVAGGFGVGGGVRVMFLTYGYVGILGQVDFIDFPGKSQNIGGVDTTILKGGWDPQIGATFEAGVHF